MSIAENKALVHRVFDEVINKKNMSVVSELIDANSVIRTAMGDFKGPDGFKQFLAPQMDAFPDFHQVIEDMVAAGDRVAFRQTLTGTHKGKLMGAPPTGKSINIRQIIIVRIANGKIAEMWPVGDLLGMMQQVGIVPPLGTR